MLRLENYKKDVNLLLQLRSLVVSAIVVCQLRMLLRCNNVGKVGPPAHMVNFKG